MRIAEIGEFGLISKIAALIDEVGDRQSPARRDLLLGIGDDAAAWKAPGGIELITTDILVEGVHFDFAYTGWKDLGWKSMAINISDINSMGGRPRYALVSLALPGRRKAGETAYGHHIAGLRRRARKHGFFSYPRQGDIDNDFIRG
jgi:thiamine-monophosphate kinase